MFSVGPAGQIGLIFVHYNSQVPQAFVWNAPSTSLINILPPQNLQKDGFFLDSFAFFKELCAGGLCV